MGKHEVIERAEGKKTPGAGKKLCHGEEPGSRAHAQEMVKQV